MSEDALLKLRLFIIYRDWLSMTQYHWAATTLNTTPATSPSKIYSSLLELNPRTTKIKAGRTVHTISRAWLSYLDLYLCLFAQQPKKHTKKRIKVIRMLSTLLKISIMYTITNLYLAQHPYFGRFFGTGSQPQCEMSESCCGSGFDPTF